MNKKKIIDILINHERLKLKPYKCPAGKITIGVGRNLEDKGITEDEAMYLLNNDVDEVIADLHKIFEGFSNFTQNRKYALIDMRFQLGYGTFRSFKKMINAILDKDWNKAGDEAEDSRYYKQVPVRAKWVVDNLKNG